MTTTIAIAGKGGTGKTTVSALLIRYLTERRLGAILAIDADPSSNLHMVLGVELDGTVGDVREETLGKIQRRSLDPGISKYDYLEIKIQECLVETKYFDLLAMGRPEGPGCYCAPNHILRSCIDRLSGGYGYIVIDNEAGLEHVSRRTTRDVDFLLIVSDPTKRGLIAAQRVVELVGELQTQVGQIHLLINRVPTDEQGEPLLPPPLAEEVQKMELPLLGLVPQDPEVTGLDARGLPMWDLPEDSAARRTLDELFARVLRERVRGGRHAQGARL
jgi:CO dehydrogenase maturation factor